MRQLEVLVKQLQFLVKLEQPMKKQGQQLEQRLLQELVLELLLGQVELQQFVE